jgi:hypothetical protein
MVTSAVNIESPVTCAVNIERLKADKWIVVKGKNTVPRPVTYWSQTRHDQ